MSKYTLTCCGGVGNATGANFLLTTPDIKVLEPFPYQATDVSYLLITHAHMDHIGRIPKLMKEGFSGTIYSTMETKELAALMLDDALNLITREAHAADLPPLYGREDVARAFTVWKTIPYHESFSLTPKISVYFKDAGHILGSAIIEMRLRGAKDDGDADLKLAFTGDLGNSPTPLLRDTEYVTDADYMVLESVYGDRNHEPKSVRDMRFKQILADALHRGGTVVIPTFSIERTQVILYELNTLIEANALPRVPVYLDSPLARKVTDVYRRHIEDFNAKTQGIIHKGDDIFDFPGLIVVDGQEESQRVDNVKGPKIIIAGSGMSVGGRVLHHEAIFLGDPNATILLVGYQVPGSIGRRIEERASSVTIAGQKIQIRAHIEKVSGYSSHKDSNNLVEFASHTIPKMKRIFVAMGENKSSTFLAQRLRSELGLDAIVPEKAKEYDLL
jgi:metallo-beta-lactamase family protein